MGCVQKMAAFISTAIPLRNAKSLPIYLLIACPTMETMFWPGLLEMALLAAYDFSTPLPDEATFLQDSATSPLPTM
jgi:hypothetical protein